MANKSYPSLFQLTKGSLREHAKYWTTSPSMLCTAPRAAEHHRRCGPHEWSVERKAKPATVHTACTCSRSVSAECGPCACALGGGVWQTRRAVVGAWVLSLAVAVPRARLAGNCGASRLARGCAQRWRPRETARGGGKEGAGLGMRRNVRACSKRTWPP